MNAKNTNTRHNSEHEKQKIEKVAKIPWFLINQVWSLMILPTSIAVAWPRNRKHPIRNSSTSTAPPLSLSRSLKKDHASQTSRPRVWKYSPANWRKVTLSMYVQLETQKRFEIWKMLLQHLGNKPKKKQQQGLQNAWPKQRLKRSHKKNNGKPSHGLQARWSSAGTCWMLWHRFLLQTSRIVRGSCPSALVC